MSRKFKVDVRQEDINYGGRSARDCPIAKAMDRLRIGEFAVYEDSLYSTIPWERYSWPDITNTNIHSWIRRYDAGLPVKPFSFDVVLD